MWLNREDIVGMMLASHVEKVHYAEHVQPRLDAGSTLTLYNLGSGCFGTHGEVQDF